MKDSTDDDWSLAKVAESDGSTRFFRKNLRPRVLPGDSEHSVLAFLTFRYKSRDARSLPETSERQILDGLDDREAYDLEGAGIAVHVAAVLGSGIKDLIFYVCDVGAFAERAGTVLKRYPQFAPSCEFSIDPNWRQYDNFPGPD